MRSLCLVAFCVTMGALRVAPLGAQDPEHPVFRSDTNAVSFEFGASIKRGRGGTAEPWTTITIGDTRVVIDRKEFRPTTFFQDKPGHYVLSLDIPDAYRDGKTHTVRFKVKKTTFPYSHTFTVPKTQTSATPSVN
jgi:hypothetical protein